MNLSAEEPIFRSEGVSFSTPVGVQRGSCRLWVTASFSPVSGIGTPSEEATAVSTWSASLAVCLAVDVLFSPPRTSLKKHFDV